MNHWLMAATVLLLALVPLGLVIARSRTIDRLVALQLSTTICIMTLLVLAVGFSRSSYDDIALAVAILSYPAGLVFAHFLERWL